MNQTVKKKCNMCTKLIDNDSIFCKYCGDEYTELPRCRYCRYKDWTMQGFTSPCLTCSDDYDNFNRK